MSQFYFYKKYPLFVRYFLATLIFFLALWARFLILPVEYGLAFITFYPAMVICFYLCGISAGTFMSGLSAVAGYYFFIPPYFQFSHSAGGGIAIITFSFSTFVIGFVIKQLQISTELLQISEQRYSAILEDQTEILCRFKVDGTILYVNEAYCRLFGKKSEKITGTKWHPQAFDEDVTFVNEQLEKLSLENNVVTIENRVYTSGGIRWYQFVNRAFFDSNLNLIEIQSVGRDITDRKRLENELVESSKEIEDLYEKAPCGYHSVGLDGTFLQINETELEWLGYRKEDVIGKMKPTDFFTNDGKLLFQKSFTKFLEQGHIEDLDFDLVHKDGSIRRIAVNATSVKDSNNNILFSRSVVHDITEREKLKTEKLFG